MMDFVYKLYGYDNFTLYLTIAIVVLVILFVLVLIFGKKDQKLEETKRLQKLELENTFKEEKTEPVKLETEAPVAEEVKEELPIMDMSTEEIPEMPEIKKEEPVLINNEADANVTVFEPVVKEDEEIPEIVIPIKEVAPTKDIEEESAPINVDDIPSFSFDEINDSIENGLNEIENIKNEFNSIEVPTIEETKEEVKEEVKPVKTYQPSKVFSSVYVSDETKPEEIKMDEPVINLEPQIKVEEPVVKPQPTLIVQDEEYDFDMPTLRIMEEIPAAEKKEEIAPVIPDAVTESEPAIKVEEPKEEATNEAKEVGTISFDDLIGETYKIQ